MIKWVMLAIIAGLVIESHQQEFDESGSASNDTSEFLPEPRLSVGPSLESEDWFHESQFPHGGKAPCFQQPHIRCWTEWFDGDDPCGSGDSETLSGLRAKFPGKICNQPTGIQVQTLSGLSVAQTGELIFRCDTITGFICRNQDQPWKKCSDYRVRFSCHPPFCGGGVCWTDWYNRDNPRGSGDWELLSDLLKEYPGQICEDPLFIEVVTTDTHTPAHITGENFFVYDPTRGFACRREDQRSRFCRDYKVRFACPCKRVTEAPLFLHT